MTSPGSPGSGGPTPPAPSWESPRIPDADAVDRLVGELRLPRPVCALLAVRGHDDADGAKRFLRPTLDQLHDPEELADGPLAADRIVRALREGETVFVHGDYDVDGICATAILTRWLRGLGGSVVPFVPHRTRDGYDFTEAGLRAAREAGAGLVVTVDCGTVAHRTVASAGALGIDVVVTDHHTVSETLPDALAVVNPQRPDCGYAGKELCGAGLAWKLAALVGERAGADRAGLEELLDLVALATVADLVPLTGENRVLVHHGLKRIARAPGVGVAALMRSAEVDPATVNAGRIGFQIAPRINAAGRIGESADALRLLLTEDARAADALARHLEGLNRSRREEDQRILDEALGQLARSYDPERDHGVVLDGAGWHPGVIGIVASRVVERIHRPVVMLARDGAVARGSARSVPGFDLYAAVAACQEHLDRFGGHRQAAGMQLRAEAIPAFREAFAAQARERMTPDLLRPTLRPDLDLELPDADLDLAHWLGYLGPHGIGNPGPTFRARGVELASSREVGSGHLKTSLCTAGATLPAIGFRMVERFPPEAVETGRWDVLFRLEKNEFRGRVTAQARLVDLRREAS